MADDPIQLSREALEKLNTEVAEVGDERLRTLDLNIVLFALGDFFVGANEPRLRDRMSPGIVKALVKTLPDATKDNLKEFIKAGNWKDLVTHRIFWREQGIDPMAEISIQALREGYDNKFHGDADVQLIRHILSLEKNIRDGHLRAYAKVLPIVQSSGIGKSRLLTEAGKHCFTLPLCLRNPKVAAFPPTDIAALDFFAKLPKGERDTLSVRAHIAVACFFGAAFNHMYTRLTELWSGGSERQDILREWHNFMESTSASNKYREDFWGEVVQMAQKMIAESMDRDKNTLLKSPDPATAISGWAQTIYDEYMKNGVEKLCELIVPSSFTAEYKPVFIPYIDEFRSLGPLYWVLLRLLSKVDEHMSLWFVAMGTKSLVTDVSGPPVDISSMRLLGDTRKVIEAYFGIGFDQMADPLPDPTTLSLGSIEGIQFHARYGRPLWAPYNKDKDTKEIVAIAAAKLLNDYDGKLHSFDDHHVLAIFSHRVALDVILCAQEMSSLATTSVAQHMRLLTGISHVETRTYYHTHAPSEPLLALGAAHAIYTLNTTSPWTQLLNALTDRLLKPGLVDRGLSGELAARFLLVLARDYSVPAGESPGSGLHRCVSIVSFLETLLGGEWYSKIAGSDSTSASKKRFCSVFDYTYINFTHFATTRASLSEKMDNLLLCSLWFRHAGLQCAFNQESLDAVLAALVLGQPISNDIMFDPMKLIQIIIQIKFKTKSDNDTELNLRPIGFCRDLDNPLPYIAVVMHLGNEATIGTTGSRIQVQPPPPEEPGKFKELVNDWKAADERYRELGILKDERRKRKTVATTKRQKMDAYNRWTFSIRGQTADTYRVLQQADISDAFRDFMRITVPAPTTEQVRQMFPFDQLEDMAWMRFSQPTEADNMDVDVGI